MRVGLNHDRVWQAEQLAIVPGAWRERVRKIHVKRLETEAEQTANLWLLGLTDRMKKIRVPIALKDDELCELAIKCAKECMDLANVYVTTDMASLRERMNCYCQRYGITPPDPLRLTKNGKEVGVTDRGAVARMTDHLWWRRNIRKTQARGLEGEAINLGYVHKRAEIYSSDATVERRTQQRKRNVMALENTQAINKDTGEIFSLFELAEKSVANPKIRRGELMTRIHGFEGVAKALGHAAEFVTLTAPSKYHAKKQDEGKVIDNPKYGGFTPRETQRYLAKTWARIRSALSRRNINLYGFRIAEPHHDGTPHWHMILFCEKSKVQKLREVISSYALKEDGHEQGAAKNRVEFVSINWKRGTAAGYVAKYVAKNIDGGGYEVQGDIEGEERSAITPSHRVEAWASTWGIRQFQPIGGPPVGVWRELRRTEDEQRHTSVISEARAAADAGNWEAYCHAMGGALKPVTSVKTWQRWGKATVRKVKRQINKQKIVVNQIVSQKRIKDGVKVERQWPISIAVTRDGERWDFTNQQPEPAPQTRYWETAKGAVFGVKDNTTGRVFQSRRYRWEIKAGARDGLQKYSKKLGLHEMQNEEFQQPESLLLLQKEAEARPQAAQPWTCVNNCTGVLENGGEFGNDESGRSGIGGFGRENLLESGTFAYSDDGGAVRGADFDRFGGFEPCSFG